MTSGRVRQSISLQPSRAAPPKSSAAEVEILHERAERAVEDDDPLVDGVEVRLPCSSDAARLPAAASPLASDASDDRTRSGARLACRRDSLRQTGADDRQSPIVDVDRGARSMPDGSRRASASPVGRDRARCRARSALDRADARRARLRGQGRPDARRAPQATARRSSPSASASRRRSTPTALRDAAAAFARAAGQARARWRRRSPTLGGVAAERRRRRPSPRAMLLAPLPLRRR